MLGLYPIQLSRIQQPEFRPYGTANTGLASPILDVVPPPQVSESKVFGTWRPGISED